MDTLTALRALTGKITPLRAVRCALHRFHNWQRGRFRDLDYILISMPQTLPPLPETRGWLRRRLLGSPPLSLFELERLFERIGSDPRPRGVILYLRGFQMSMADLQTLRGSIIRLRRRGKRVLCYAQDYDNASYYVASAADEIILQPGGSLNTIGLVAQPTFLKNSLERIGIQLDVVAISPYKGALDGLSRDMISPEGRQQLDWLLDSRYRIILEGIAEGRRMTMGETREMIDAAPHIDTHALERCYVDAVLNEEALPAHLNTQHIIPLAEASRWLLKPWQQRSRKYVALVPLAGMIVPGESAAPPADIPLPLPFVADDRLGDVTVVRQVRSVMADENAAAVVLWIDSPGGSAAASEAMAAALDELARTRPVVAFMNSVAASGGYYIATPARWIVAQPGTTTGSIGVILAKAVTYGLFQNLMANRIEITRGANANIFSDGTAFSDAQRQQMRRSIERSYEQFVGRVARSRSMTPAAVDAVGGGRVWTGRQALEHGLIDEVGDIYAAFAKARALAQLPDDAPVVMTQPPSQPLAPQAAAASPAASLQYLLVGFRVVASGSAQFLLPLKLD